MDRYKITTTPDGSINGCRILRMTEEGIPCEWIDDVGGNHDCGVGVGPDGTYCGECDSITCNGCRIWKR